MWKGEYEKNLKYFSLLTFFSSSLEYGYGAVDGVGVWIRNLGPKRCGTVYLVRSTRKCSFLILGT